ncbi:MAG: DUF4173 domain-containing protein [Clostridia bacterium]|nr:DUF4173 domain-containing protein [Clostridia bacterium]
MNNDFNPIYTPSPSESEPVQSRFTVGESFFAWFCVLAGYLFCRAFPPTENPIGMFLVFIIILIATVIVLATRKFKFGSSAVVSAIMSAITAGAAVFTSVDFVQIIGFLCSGIAYAYFIYSATGNRLENGMSDLLPIDLLKALFLLPFSCFVRLWVAMFSGRRVGWKFVLKAFIGFAVAIIPTAIVISLLSYDSAFTELFDKIFSFIEDFNVFSHMGSLLLGGVVAMYVFGLYSASATNKLKDAFKAESCHNAASKLHFAPVLTVGAALLPLASVYVIFFISQMDFYLSAFKGVLPDAIGYADYARNGFFELCAVSAINLVVLAAVSMFVRREGRGGKLFLKIASVVLSLMTLALIANAAAKMVLYIKRYGLTERRVEASWFMVLLALIFVLIIFKQIFAQMKIISASAISTALMLSVLLFSDYNAIIADYNVDNYISGDLQEVDVDALYELGSPAVPALVRLAEYNDSEFGTDIANDVNNWHFFVEHPDHYEIVFYIRAFNNDIDIENTPFTALTVSDIKAKKALNDYLNK